MQFVIAESLRQLDHRIRVGLSGIGAPPLAGSKVLDLFHDVGDRKPGDAGVFRPAFTVRQMA